MPEAAKAKSSLKRMLNRLLHTAARTLPGAESLRPVLHRWRGVAVGRGVFIGDDVYLENEYPEAIEIGDGCEVGLRSVIIAHLRGPGRIVIKPRVWIGASCTIASASGRTLTIGEGAVIAAGSIVTADVPEHAFIRPAPSEQAAIANTPLAGSTYSQFLRGLRPIRRSEPETSAPAITNSTDGKA